MLIAATLDTAVGWAQIVSAIVTTVYVILTFGLLVAAARSTRASAALAKAAVAPAAAISVSVHSDEVGVYIQWNVDSWDTVRVFARPRRTDFGYWAPPQGLALEPREGGARGVVVYRPNNDVVDHRVSLRIHRAGARLGSAGTVTLLRSGRTPTLRIGAARVGLDELADVPTYTRADRERGSS